MLFNSTSNNRIFSSNVVPAFTYWQNFIKKENLLIFYHFSCQNFFDFLGTSVARSKENKEAKIPRFLYLVFGMWPKIQF